MKNYLYNFLEDREIRKIISEEDLIKITNKDSPGLFYITKHLKQVKKMELFKDKRYGKNNLKIMLREREREYGQLALTGFPDLFVWDKKGGYFFVEVKSEKDKLHRSQYEWIRWNNKEGKFIFKILNILNKK